MNLNHNHRTTNPMNINVLLVLSDASPHFFHCSTFREVAERVAVLEKQYNAEEVVSALSARSIDSVYTYTTGQEWAWPSFARFHPSDLAKQLASGEIDNADVEDAKLEQFKLREGFMRDQIHDMCARNLSRNATIPLPSADEIAKATSSDITPGDIAAVSDAFGGTINIVPAYAFDFHVGERWLRGLFDGRGVAIVAYDA